MPEKIFYDGRQLYFEFKQFTLDGETTGIYFLSSNTAMLCRNFLLKYGYWKNRYTYDLSKRDMLRLNDADMAIINDIIDLAIQELTMDATEELGKMAKSLQEIEFTLKNNRANSTSDKVVKWFGDKPLPPSDVNSNPYYESQVQGNFEYKNPNGTFTPMTNVFFDFFTWVKTGVWLAGILEQLTEVRWYIARFYALITNNKNIKYFGTKTAMPTTDLPSPVIAQTDVLSIPQEIADISLKLNDLVDGTNQIKDKISLGELALTQISHGIRYLYTRFSKSKQIVNAWPMPESGAIDAPNDSVFDKRNNDDTETTITEAIILGLVNPLDNNSYFGTMSENLGFISSTLSGQIRLAIEYIGKAFNLSPIGSPNQYGFINAFLSAFFTAGNPEIRDGNGFLDQIARKQTTVNVNPNVTAKVDLNESGLTINNNVVPATVTINNQVQTPTIHNELKQVINVDACCDDNTPVKDPVTGNYPPIDPTDPKSPTTAPNITKDPFVVPKVDPTKVPANQVQILRAKAKNAYCGYIYYSFTQFEGFLKSVDELLEPLSQLWLWFGGTWVGKYIIEKFNTLTIGFGKVLDTINGNPITSKGVSIAKVGAVNLEKVGTFYFALQELNITIDVMIEQTAIMKNQIACEATGAGYEDTTADGTYFYSSTANYLLNAGFTDEVSKLWGGFMKDFIDFGYYDAYFDKFGEVPYSDYEKYCPCPNQVPDPVDPVDPPFNGGNPMTNTYANVNTVDGKPVFWSTCEYFRLVDSQPFRSTPEYSSFYGRNTVFGFQQQFYVNEIHPIIGSSYQYISKILECFDIAIYFQLEGVNQGWIKQTGVDSPSLSPIRITHKGWTQQSDTSFTCHVLFDISAYVIGETVARGGENTRYRVRLCPSIRYTYTATKPVVLPSGVTTPFSVTPNNGAYTANWSNVTVPVGATVLLKANGVNVPHSNAIANGTYDPVVGSNLVLSIATYNQDGSITTTEYKYTIDPITPPNSFTAQLERIESWAYYLDLTNAGITANDSYTLTINGLYANADTYGIIPLQLQDYVGLLTFEIVVTTANNGNYTLTTTVDKPVYDPCNGSPVNVSDLRLVRQPYSSLIDVSFTPSSEVDRIEVYDNGTQAFANSSNGQVYLDRGIAHIIKAVVHKYGALDCKAEISATYAMPNLEFVKRSQDYYSVMGGWACRQFDLVNPIAYGLNLNKQVNIPATNGSEYWYVPSIAGTNQPLPLYTPNQYGDWVFSLGVERIVYDTNGNDSYFYGENDGVLAFGFLTTAPLAITSRPNGDIWLRLEEFYGTPVINQTPTTLVTDLQGLYRRVVGSGLNYWATDNSQILSNHPDLYTYTSQQGVRYLSFAFNTPKQVVSVLCGVFSLNDWSLITTFYLQGLNTLRVGNVVAVGGYKFNGITLPANTLVTVIEVGLVD